MQETDKKRRSYHVRLPLEIGAKIEKIVEETGLPRNSVMLLAVNEFLANKKADA